MSRARGRETRSGKELARKYFNTVPRAMLSSWAIRREETPCWESATTCSKRSRRDPWRSCMRRCSVGVRLVVRASACSGASKRAASRKRGWWMVARQAAFQRFSGVHEEMKAVGDLDSVGGRKRRRSSVVAAAVAAHNLHFGMTLEPASKAHLFAVGQQVNHRPAFQVDEHRAVGASSAKGEIIDTEHSHQWRSRLWPSA